MKKSVNEGRYWFVASDSVGYEGFVHKEDAEAFDYKLSVT